MINISVKTIKTFELFVNFIKERESIRKKKEARVPRPWSDYVVLNDWRFCNVNRNHDRETVWIIENIVAKHRHDMGLWFNLVLARFVNWRETLAEIGYVSNWDPVIFKKVMRERGERKKKVWTGAYLVPSGPKGVLRHDFLADEVFTPLWEARDKAPIESKLCQAWSDFFRDFKCMGDFMRNQIITDMKYTPYLLRSETYDWETFCLAGPGTMRGLNRYYSRPLNKKFDQLTSNIDLRNVRTEIMSSMPDEINDYFKDLNNLSNCFCEFDKYMRVLNNEGKPRSRYVPTVE